MSRKSERTVAKKKSDNCQSIESTGATHMLEKSVLTVAKKSLKSCLFIWMATACWGKHDTQDNLEKKKLTRLKN